MLNILDVNIILESNKRKLKSEALLINLELHLPTDIT